MDWQIRQMTAADIPALCEIEKACFSTPWSAAALTEELTNPAAVFLTAAARDGTVAGYAGMLTAAGEGYFTNIAVSPFYRRQGAARALLAALTAAAQARRLSRLTLEVRLSNTAARTLYARAGFVEDGVRPRFYRAPVEDAMIYSLYFNEKKQPIG